MVVNKKDKYRTRGSMSKRGLYGIGIHVVFHNELCDEKGESPLLRHFYVIITVRNIRKLYRYINC